MKARILLVEDDRALGSMLKDALTDAGYDVDLEVTGEAALGRISAATTLVVTDVHLAGKLHGTELCAALKERDRELPILVITAHGTMEVAIQSLRAGADDLLIKPFDVAVLLHAVARVEKAGRLASEVKALRKALDEEPVIGDLIGKSPALRKALDLVRRVADTDVSVLVTGESGTGKELVARALHNCSRRQGKPFVAINCSAVPETLLESQLFGHVRGAFTDAKTDRKGLFVAADGGTLFLDEIGDMPVALQPKLLRVLQERTVMPVGGDRETPFNVRVVAATHKDIQAAIAQGTFREDLFYRLDVVEIALPSLRDRGSDVLVLAQHFARSFAAKMKKDIAGLSGPAAEKLLAYDWPGNVRELSNCIERAVALSQGSELIAGDLPERVLNHSARRLVFDAHDLAAVVKLAEVEKRYILEVYEACQREKKKAATLLGVDRKTLYRKLEEYGVWKPGDVES